MATRAGEADPVLLEERRHRARRVWTLVVVLVLVTAQLFVQDIISLLNTMAQGWDASGADRAWARMHVLSAALFLIGVVVLFVGRRRATLLWIPLLLGLGAAVLQIGSILPYTEAVFTSRNVAVRDPTPGMIAEAVREGGWRALVGAGLTWLAAVVLLAITLVHVPRAAPRWHGPRRSLRRRLRDGLREGGWVRGVFMNPAALFFGPIFFKEVRVLGRKRGTYFTRLFYPLGLLGIVSLVYSIAITEIQHGSGAQRLQRLQEIAPQLAVSIAWFQFVLLLLIAPTLMGPAICEERRTRTLSALMTTPMTSAQIVFGNFASRLVQVLILALVSAPFLLAIRLFGGLEAEIILAIEAITISSVLFMGALGLLFSIWCRRPVVASAAAVLSFLILTLIPILIIALAAAQMRGRPPLWLIPFGAPVALMGVTTEMMGGGPGLTVRGMWTVNTAVNLACTVVVCLLAAGALRRIMLSDAVEIKRPVSRRRRARKKAATPAPAVDADDPSAVHDAGEVEAGAAPETQDEVVYEERETVVGDRPVLWRELRAPAAGSSRNRAIVLTVAGLALAWLYYEMPPWHDDVHYVVGVVVILLMCLHAALSTSGAVAGEKEASTWMVLLTTPLTPMEILLGKAAGALRRHWMAAAVLGFDLVLGVVLGALRPIILVHIALVAGGVALFFAGTGLLFSTVFRKGTTAAALNVGLAVLLWMGVPTLGFMLGELFQNLGAGIDDDHIGDAVMSFNPVFLTVMSLEGASGEYRHLHEYRFPSGRVSSLEFTTILMGVSGLYALGGAACTRFAAKLLPRLSGRTS